jgi:predicted transposase YbfD/YdcC
VSAWACDKGLTLAQAFVDEKSNEITAVPKLLKMLNLEGAVVSLDAMGTQRGNASDIVEAGADYVLCVKGNQGDLHKELIDQFEFAARQLGAGELSKTNWSDHHEEEKNRGRLERRRTIVCHNLDWMDAKIRSAWQALACIVLVQRQVLLKSGKWRTEVHYYISSLEGVKAKKMQKYIRSHWQIENSCHWVLDTLFREDHNQTGKRNAAKNLSTLRRIALNALKRATDHSKRKRPSSLPKKQLRAAQDEAYLEEVLSLV